MQRRAAVALLAFIVVVGVLGASVYMVGGGSGGGNPIASLTAGEAALKTIRADLGQVFAPGVDLVDGDPKKALELLTGAYQAIDAARKASVPAGTLDPLVAQTVGGLDRLYRVRPVGVATIISFAGGKMPFDIQSMILGPDGVPYVLDKATSAVYRIDLRTKKATTIYRDKNRAAGATEAVPKILATGGRDLLVVDTRNVVWRWRAKDAKGNGTTTTVRVAGARGSTTCTSWTPRRRTSSRIPRPATGVASHRTPSPGWRSPGTCRRSPTSTSTATSSSSRTAPSSGSSAARARAGRSRRRATRSCAPRRRTA
jgi:hypothetical protein